MRRALLASGVGLLLACGSGEPEPQSQADPAETGEQPDRPPHVEALAIVPERPTTEDAIAAGLRVYDPDGDPLSIEWTWYRNGAVHEAGGSETIDPGEFVRGDHVWVEAVISDGDHELDAKSEPVVIANALPHAAGIRITPPQPTASDMLEVELRGADADGDPVQWSYRWLVDGEPLQGAEGARLAPGRAKRGSSVVVEVSGNDGHEDGEWIASESVRIANASPRIVSQPAFELASPGQYAYEVKAEDPDGDAPLRYELGEAPPAMSIDPASGLITWPVPSDARGSYPVEIQVSDSHGGRAAQRYALQISWQPVAEPEPEPDDDAPASEAEDDFGDETDDDADF
jgi:hypothetical protein